MMSRNNTRWCCMSKDIEYLTFHVSLSNFELIPDKFEIVFKKWKGEKYSNHVEVYGGNLRIHDALSIQRFPNGLKKIKKLSYNFFYIRNSSRWLYTIRKIHLKNFLIAVNYFDCFLHYESPSAMR